MRNFGRLWIARCATGVNVKERICAFQASTECSRNRGSVIKGRNFGIQILEAFPTRTRHTEPAATQLLSELACNYVRVLMSNKENFRIANLKGMAKGPSAEIEINERGDHPQLGHRQPHDDEFWSIVHH
jgi:hypothetical protein